MRLAIERTLARFGVVGIINTMAGLTIIFVAKWLGGLGDVMANLVGYGVGVMISFVLNRQWTFGHVGPRGAAFVRFVLVLTVAYMLNLLTVLGAISVGINGYMAQAMGIIPYFAFSYLASKHLVFPVRRDAPADAPRSGL